MNSTEETKINLNEIETKIKREDEHCSFELNNDTDNTSSNNTSKHSSSRSNFEVNSSYPSFHSLKRSGKFSKSKSLDLNFKLEKFDEVSEGKIYYLNN